MIQKTILGYTAKNRPIEMLKLGNWEGPCQYRIVLTARHHCCESIANFVWEGILDTFLTGKTESEWLLRNTQLIAVPFMDKDGVEDGDQGKDRLPFDHNRDYTQSPIYSSVKALKEFVRDWHGGKLRLGLDLHCPELAGSLHELIHFVGPADSSQTEQMQRFSQLLEKNNSGPLPYLRPNNLLFGISWNTIQNAPTFRNWISSIPGAVGLSLEIPYADAGGVRITPENARKFGNNLAETIVAYLES